MDILQARRLLWKLDENETIQATDKDSTLGQWGVLQLWKELKITYVTDSDGIRVPEESAANKTKIEEYCIKLHELYMGRHPRWKGATIPANEFLLFREPVRMVKHMRPLTSGERQRLSENGLD